MTPVDPDARHPERERRHKMTGTLLPLANTGAERRMSNETKPERPLRVALVTAGLYFDPMQAQNLARHASWLGGYGLARGFVRAFRYMAFVIGFAVRSPLAGKRPYDLPVSSDPFNPGALAMLAGRILGIPYAIELNGNYAAAMALEDGTTSSSYMRLKARFAWFLVPREPRGAGALKLLYEDQFGEFATPALRSGA